MAERLQRAKAPLGERVIDSYRDCQCLVTGGLGFIGSNLAIGLVRLGAKVTLVDARVAGCGANLVNIRSIADSVEVIEVDVGQPEKFIGAIRRADVIFNLAGETSHSHSQDYPERDLALNVAAQLRFLRECAHRNAGVRVVYASTRQVYGPPKFVPVHEEHPVEPVDFNGVHKATATEYHLLLARNGGIDPVILRLSNVYGPRMALNITCQGFLSVYLRRALLGQALDVYGDGSQIRDPAYIDDVVDAFLRVGMSPQPPHRIYNVGGSEQLSMERIATMISRVSGGVAVVRCPFPESRKQIDIGSYYSDTSRLRDDLAWRCNTPFKMGLTQTFDFYRSQICEYLDLTNTEQQCSWCDARKEPVNRQPALAS